MTLLIYQYPKCGTCRKAKKFLQNQEISFRERHMVEEPPTYDELKEWVSKSQLPIKKFFNTSGKRYRELQLSRKRDQMTEEEQLRLLASDGMLIKRPIVTDGEKVTVGFNEEIFMDTWVSPNHSS